jgi:predicted XRE-type DNA-binding protein
MSQSDYLELVTKYNKAAAEAAANGKQPYLHKGKSDVFRVFMKHGALSHPSIINRLKADHGIETFVKQNRRNNFKRLCMWIAANVCLETRTFSSNGTQGQIAEMIGVDQSTVSRLLALMVKMRVITPAFTGDKDPTEPKAGLVFDEQGLPYNQVYKVEDDFGYLAGPTAGMKLESAFRKADEKAFANTGWNLHERLLTVRNTLWEGTIERRTKNITQGCLKRTISKITDRSRAVQIIFNRMKKRGEHLLLNGNELDRMVNARLVSCGFSA